MNPDDVRLLADVLVVLMSSGAPRSQIVAALTGTTSDDAQDIARAFIAAAWNADRGSPSDRAERVQAWLVQLRDAV